MVEIWVYLLIKNFTAIISSQSIPFEIKIDRHEVYSVSDSTINSKFEYFVVNCLYLKILYSLSLLEILIFLGFVEVLVNLTCICLFWKQNLRSRFYLNFKFTDFLKILTHASIIIKNYHRRVEYSRMRIRVLILY